MATSQPDQLARCAREYASLKAELRDLDYVCVGTVLTRRLQCGNPGCRCHRSPAARHGPYHYWTRKVRGKTVSVLLSADEAALYRAWIENNRRFEKVVRSMRKLSADALKLTLRTNRR